MKLSKDCQDAAALTFSARWGISLCQGKRQQDDAAAVGRFDPRVAARAPGDGAHDGQAQPGAGGRPRQGPDKAAFPAVPDALMPG